MTTGHLQRGIRENRGQVAHQLIQVLLAGFALGMTRTVVPALAESEFGLTRGSFLLFASFVVAFAQETPEAVSTQWRAVADQILPKVPKLAAIMDDAEADVLTDMTFPKEHRAKLHSTNPIERLNDEIKRRTDVVGIFPNDEAIIRLVGAILLEQNDEWAVQRARYMTLQTISQSRRERCHGERQASVNNPLVLAVMVSVLPAVTATSAPELSSRKYPTSGLSLTNSSAWTTAMRAVRPAPVAGQLTGSQVKLQIPPLRVQATVMAAPPAV